LTNYILKPVEVLAFEYQGEPRDQWPQWVKDYTGATTMGFSPISNSITGALLVPSRATRDGSMGECHKGDWIVSATGKNDALVVKGIEFKTLYSPVAD
jgi:hypothetical protein